MAGPLRGRALITRLLSEPWRFAASAVDSSNRVDVGWRRFLGARAV